MNPAFSFRYAYLPRNSKIKYNLKTLGALPRLLESPLLACISATKDLQSCPPFSISQTQVHSAKTHHLALLSANTRPLQTPLSPHLMIVSQVPPSPPSRLALWPRSSFLISLKILPPGAWIANFAGFLLVYPLLVLGFDPEAEELVIDIAELGRMKGMGEVPPGFGEGEETEDGCWRTAKTKVLFAARRWH